MSDLFALPGGLAKDFGVTEISGCPVSGDEWVWPACACLPMGFSWSVYFAQQVALQNVSHVDGFSLEDSLQDDIPDRCISDRLRFFVYIDNIGVIGKNADEVNDRMRRIKEMLERCGLKTHDHEVAALQQDVLGVTLDGSKRVTRASSVRYCRVRCLLRWLLAKRYVSGELLEIVLGHLTYIALVNRPFLSCFHVVYKYVHAVYSEPRSKLWTGARRELEAFYRAMPLLQSRWDLDWAEEVCATDACLGGFGVVSGTIDSSTVRRVASTTERSRYKRCMPGTDGVRARNVLDLDPYLDPRTVLDEDGDFNALLPVVEEDGGFEDIPLSLLDSVAWKVHDHGRFHFREPIHVLEARAQCNAFPHLAHHWYRRRFLFLMDNMSDVLALSRSRAHDFKLLLQVRRTAALCFITESRPHYRWVPSEWNPGDKPSRVYELAFESSNAHKHEFRYISHQADQNKKVSSSPTCISSSSSLCTSPSSTIPTNPANVCVTQEPAAEHLADVGARPSVLDDSAGCRAESSFGVSREIGLPPGLSLWPEDCHGERENPASVRRDSEAQVRRDFVTASLSDRTSVFGTDFVDLEFVHPCFAKGQARAMQTRWRQQGVGCSEDCAQAAPTQPRGRRHLGRGCHGRRGKFVRRGEHPRWPQAGKEQEAAAYADVLWPGQRWHARRGRRLVPGGFGCANAHGGHLRSGVEPRFPAENADYSQDCVGLCPGREVGSLPSSPVRQRFPCFEGREAGRRVPELPSAVWEERESEGATVLEGSTGLSSTCSCSIPEASHLARGGCSGELAGPAWALLQGRVASCLLGRVLAAFRLHAAQEVRLRAAHEWDLGPLVPEPEPSRGGPLQQDRCLGRGLDLGRLGGDLDGSRFPSVAGDGRARLGSVGLHVPRFHADVSARGQGAQAAPHGSLSDPALGAKLGATPQPAKPLWSGEERALESPIFPGPLREVRDGDASLPPDPGRPASLLRELCSRAERRDAADTSPCPTSLASCGDFLMSDGNCSLKSEHVPECDLLLDLFGGVGYVSKYIRGYGWQSENFDVVLDPTQDITNGSTLRSLLTRIRNREFSAIMIGMPCTSFSVARDRTCQIRSMLEPWGLLNQSKFSEKDIKSLRNGNSIAKAVIKMLHLIMELRIPAILENPRSSRFWHLPQVKRIVAGHAASFVTCDLCQFGTKWRKRTGLLCLNLDPTQMQ